jgi:cysteine desulfurase
MPKIYLNSHAATRPLAASIEAILPLLQAHWGQDLIPSLNRYVESILQALGADLQDAFYFFSSHAEAVKHLFLSHYLEEIRSSGRNHILTTNTEEVPILDSLRLLEELGCYGKILPVSEQGQLTRAALEEAIGPRTALVSLSWANGLTGVIHPIADLVEVCRAKDVRIHVDASYAIGKYFCNMRDAGVDFLTFEGSLVHAPQGTAGLLIRHNSLSASAMGAPAWGVAALARALEEGAHTFDHVCLETARLRDKLEKGIQEGFPEAQVLFQTVERLPNCTAIAFPGVVSEALLFLLHRKGIYASIGGGHSQMLSSLLIAAGYEPQVARSALSFSLCFETTESEIDEAIQGIVACAQKLKGLSHRLVGEHL